MLKEWTRSNIRSLHSEPILSDSNPELENQDTPNDSEEEEFRKKEDESNLQTATIAQTMKNAGLQMDAKYFEDRTGIPATVSTEKPLPVFSNKIKNKLHELYE